MNANDALIFMPALPELILACAGMALLMFGVFRGDRSTQLVSWLSVAVLLIAGILVVAAGSGRTFAFGGAFIVDDFAQFMKVLALLGSGLAILMSLDYLRREGMWRFEYPVLMLIATLGMMMMISANDLIALYLGLELLSLPSYVLAAFSRDSVRSTEAGLKYFVLGSLASGMYLYGASLVYGFGGTTEFGALAQLFAGAAPGQASVGVIVGIVFIAAGLAFKISAVPFHMWTPDVYEGSPTPVTAFFAVAPKIAAIALFVRVFAQPFAGLVGEWQQVMVVISVGSMLIGAYAAINQVNIKRLMAYSSIGHVGYALIGLAAGTEFGVRGVLIYMALYLFMTVGAWGVILVMRRQGRMVEDITDLAGLSRTHPMTAAAMAIFMFSLAGIPPLAGFFSKLFIFQAAIQAGLVTLAVIGVLTSVVGAFYYIRIVKLMYFDEAVEPLDRRVGGMMGLILAVMGVVNILFGVYPLPILAPAEAAASALFGG